MLVATLYQQHVITTVPTAPHNLEYNTTITGNMFNITLTWSRPDPPNGLITQYNVSDIINSFLVIV